MKERKVDLFSTLEESDVDAICITTNGHWDVNGLAVMGGGCARVCADRWPQTAVRLGFLLKSSKLNDPFVIGALDPNLNYIDDYDSKITIPHNKFYKSLILSYPTIDNLMIGATIYLIEKSSRKLVSIADKHKLNNIVSGRPGSGIGGLAWADVKTIIEPILDDRFTIVSFKHEVP